ncbi:MAG: FecR domain-containing protein [Odoribacter splanchnicus]
MTYSEKDIEYALQIIHHREELDELMVIEWLDSLEHQQLLEEIALWGQIVDDRFIGDVEIAKRKVCAKLKQRRRRMILRFSVAAASIAIFLIVGILLFIKPEQTITIAEAEKGDYTTLILADGEVVNLEMQGGEIFRGSVETIINDTKRSLKCNRISAELSDTLIKWNVLKVPVGQTYHVLLADGTQVWLNAATELQFPTNFGGSFRNVKLKGEAYFEVTKNLELPFRVEIAPEISIEVLGTSFNVKAYGNEDKIEALLEKGKIRMEVNGDSVELFPGDLGSYDRLGRHIDLIRPENVDKYLAWRSGKFIFENASLSVVFKEIARWYGVQVKYCGDNIPDFKISGNLRRILDLEMILKALEKTGEIKFEIQDQTLLVRSAK